MATAAQLAYGSTLEYSTDDGTTWTAVIEAKTAGVPPTEPEFVEVTSLDSTGGFKEYIEGLKDTGEIEISCNYTRAGYQALAALDGTLVDWRTTFANGDKFEYEGISRVSVDQVEVGEARKMTLKIRVSGQPTFTAGA